MNSAGSGEPHAGLERLLRRAVLRWRARDALENLFAWLLCLAAVVASASWVIEAQRFDADIVGLARLLVMTVAALGLGALLVAALRTRHGRRDTALYLERRSPALDGVLLTATGAAGDARDSGLWRGVVERAVVACARLDVVDGAERLRLRRAGLLLGGLLLVLTAALLLAPAGLRHATALLLPWSDPQAAIPYRLDVSPGTVTVVAGSDLRVQARSEGFRPAAALLAWRRMGDAGWMPLPMLGDGDTGYEALLFDLGADIEYRVEAEGVRSAVYRVSVLPRPVVERIDITYHYPPATGRAPETHTDAGGIAAVRGTRAQLRVVPASPVAAGRLVVDAVAPQALVARADGAWSGSIDVQRDGHYRVELDVGDGRFTPATPQFPIRAYIDTPPVVEIRRPGRDAQVTAIEELDVEVSARDDVIVRDLELVVSINGGGEEVIPLGGAVGVPSMLISETLALEERGLEPGDLVAFHARAADGEGEGANRASSDLYFLEVRPFDRIFRRTEGGGGGGGGGAGGQQAGLAEQQRELVVALFNVQRDGAPDEDSLRERARVLSQAQVRVRDRTDAIVRRLGTRPVVEMNPGYRAMADELPRASAAMLRVEALLAARDIGGALEPARAALRHLQRADAAFREVQVARQGGAGQGQAGASEAGDLANLFALEMDRFRSQYSGVQRGRWQQPGEREADRVAEQLRQLAARQQREVERLRQRRLQSEAGGGVASQQQLEEEIERLQRELQRLSLQRPEQQALSEALRRAREAARQMRTAGEQGSEQAGREALAELRAAAAALDGTGPERLAEGVDDARERTARLADRQRELSDAARRGEPGGSKAQRLAQKDDMAARLDALKDQVERLAREAREASTGASRALRDAADTLRSNRLAEAMRRARARVQLNPEEADPRAEAAVAEALEAARQRLAEAGEQLRDESAEPAGETGVPAELASLVERLEEAEQRFARGSEQREQGGGTAGVPGRGEGSGQGDVQGEDEGGVAPAQSAGSPGGAGAGGPFGGGAQPGTIASGGGGIGAGAWGAFRGSLDTRARQLDDFRRTLPPGSGVARDIEAVVAGLLDIAEDELASPQHALERHGELLERLRRIRAALAAASEDAPPPLVARGRQQAPAGWETLVDEYYRTLAATPR